MGDRFLEILIEVGTDKIYEWVEEHKGEYSTYDEIFDPIFDELTRVYEDLQGVAQEAVDETGLPNGDDD